MTRAWTHLLVVASLGAAVFMCSVQRAAASDWYGRLEAGYGPTDALAFGDHGRTLLSVNSPVIRAWNLQTHGERIIGRTYEPAVLSPNGTRFAVETSRGVELRDVATGRSLGRLYRTKDNDGGLCWFSRDGKVVVAFREDTETVRAWDAATRRTVGRPVHLRDAVIIAAAVSPDGTTLAIGDSWDPRSTISFRDIRTGRREGAAIDIGNFGFDDLQFSPDGRTLAAATIIEGKPAVRFWDVRSGREQGRPIRGAYGVTYSPDGRTMAVEELTAVVILDTRTRHQIGSALPCDGAGVAISPDGREIATGSRAGIAQVFDVRTHRELGLYPDAFEAVAFSPDGSTLAAASYGGAVHLVDSRTLSALGRPLRVSPYGPVEESSLAFSADGRMLAAAGPAVRLWALPRRAPLPLPSQRTDISRIALTPDARTLIAAEAGYRSAPIELIDLEARLAWALPLVDERDEFFVESFAVAPDGGDLAVVGSDLSEEEAIHLFDLRTRTLLTTFGEGGEYGAAVFSPDGHTLAVAGSDGATVWDVTTGEMQTAPLADAVVAVAFSPDGSSLATGSGDGTVRIWDTHTFAEIGRPLQDDPPVTGLAFSPDGRLLASSGYGDVRLWDVQSQIEVGPPMTSNSR